MGGESIEGWGLGPCDIHKYTQGMPCDDFRLSRVPSSAGTGLLRTCRCMPTHTAQPIHSFLRRLLGPVRRPLFPIATSGCLCLLCRGVIMEVCNITEAEVNGCYAVLPWVGVCARHCPGTKHLGHAEGNPSSVSCSRLLLEQPPRVLPRAAPIQPLVCHPLPGSPHPLCR